MTALLQISDAHFGTEVPGVAAALARLVDLQKPDLLVWTGDLTQRARGWQFEAARRFIARLPVPSVTMPGNHDLPLYNLALRLIAPYRGYRRAFGDELEREVQTEGLLLLMVKTTRRWRHKRGELSAAQVQHVAERVRQADPRQLRVVATHQPLCVNDRKDSTQQLRAPADTLQRWTEAGVDIVLSGHTHAAQCFPSRAAGRRVWMVQAGTATSSRVRGTPNSVNLLKRAGDQGVVQVERWDFDLAVGGFVCGERIAAELDRAKHMP